MTIITKDNFITMLPTLAKKIQSWYKLKVEFIEDDDNWNTVVDFWDWVDAKEVLEFLESENGWEMEKTAIETR